VHPDSVLATADVALAVALGVDELVRGLGVGSGQRLGGVVGRRGLRCGTAVDLGSSARLVSESVERSSGISSSKVVSSSVWFASNVTRLCAKDGRVRTLRDGSEMFMTGPPVVGSSPRGPTEAPERSAIRRTAE
jgi:hypothetical protein